MIEKKQNVWVKLRTPKWFVGKLFLFSILQIFTQSPLNNAVLNLFLYIFTDSEISSSAQSMAQKSPEDLGNSELANMMKEKTPMCLVNELARYNKVFLINHF